MVNNSSNRITTRSFSRVFEQMCNFIAVAKTGDPQATISGLVKLCLIESPDEHFDTADYFREMIETLFDRAIPNSQIEEALDALERCGMINRPAGTNYKLSKETEKELRRLVQETKDLEERVKSTWFEQLTAAYSKLSPDEAWKALRSYLSYTFQRHGIQAAALLDPTIDTSPEHEVSLSVILRDAIRENIPVKLHIEAERALSGFMELVGTDDDRSNYIIQLADGAFNFYTLEIPADLTEKLRSELSELTLFLDTNFLFGVMDLTYNAQVEVSLDLLRAISDHRLPFKLRFHEETKHEMLNTINFYGDILRSRAWTRSLSKAASQARNLTGIEQKFHEKNAVQSIDVDEFLRPYQHLDQLLAEKSIKIYRPHAERQQAQVDLYHDYKDFLDNNRRGLAKPYETVMHDAKMLEEARHLRSDAKSSLEAGALVITCDYYLYRFDWETARCNGQLACVLLPNIFWQILRPFIPPDRNFEKAFAETFALPEFRALGGSGSKACSKMLQILATYKDVPEETAFKMLSNDLLLDKLRTTQDEAQFAELVEVAFVEENKNLLEEKAALEQQLEAEKYRVDAEASARVEERQKHEQKQEELNTNLAEVSDDLATIRRAMEEHKQVVNIAAQRVEQSAQFANDALSKVQVSNQDAKKAERTTFRMSVIAGFSLGALLILCFELSVHLIPCQWLVFHKNTLPLQIGFSLAILCATVGLLVRDWRKWCWGVALSIFLAVLTLMGGR